MNEIDHLHYYPEVSGIHPACLAVPPMTEEEFKHLADDIEKNGLSQPIILTPEKELLDGRHRLRACYERMVEVRFKETVVDPWIYTISANIKRRHLTVGQISAFGLALMDEERRKAKERQEATQIKDGQTVSKNIDAPDKGKATEAVAEQLGVSHASISKVIKVKEQTPELVGKLKSNEITLESAYQEARRQEQQDKAVEEKRHRPVPKTRSGKPMKLPAMGTPETGPRLRILSSKQVKQIQRMRDQLFEMNRLVKLYNWEPGQFQKHVDGLRRVLKNIEQSAGLDDEPDEQPGGDRDT